ncbi:transmembrane protein 198-like [Pseudochaenichthys georgianus]|uniref:transmembrane protein 198-like n=1 Tax=Pseudochaenichthys georgianus TaxID=52239 RepID=UPI00146BE0E2|nr:transmembrane protein 198-like [Pseudochaenichthys georgianus]XP_033942327.1 transmembrane protein 198-like [Pseudochaenichthys georgianus]
MAAWLYVPQEPGALTAGGHMCSLQDNIKLEVLPMILCSAGISAGLVYLLIGYRCFKAAMFLCGFLCGSVSLPLLHLDHPLMADLCPGTRLVLGLGIGLLTGLMALLVPPLGLLLSGLQLGALLSVGPLMLLAHFHSLGPVLGPLSVVLASGLIVALMTLRWQKVLIIAYTSVLGSAVVLLSLDLLLGGATVLDQLFDVFTGNPVKPLCWFNWAIAGLGPILALIGGAVQWRFTARGFSHKEAAYKKQKKHVKKHKYRELRRRPPPHRRRRPPPLKRYAGDVLAPSYLQCLQERQQGTGSSSSSSSSSRSLVSAAHTLIDFDFETGSMVSLTSAATPVYTVGRNTPSNVCNMHDYVIY